MTLRTTLEHLGFRSLRYFPKPKAEENIEDRENQYNQCCPKDHSIHFLF